MSTKILGLVVALSVLSMSLVLGEQKTRQLELSMSIYPKEVAFGDTCYILITATNHSDETAVGHIPKVEYLDSLTMVHFDLTRNEKTWQGVFEHLLNARGNSLRIPGYSVLSGETRVFLAVPVQFPRLLELHKPFWDKILKELKDNPNGLVFDFGIDFPAPALPLDYGGLRMSFGIRSRLSDEVTVNLRNAKEMEMIEGWYQKTMKNSQLVMDKIWCCIHRGNHYPNYPNAPETWQGWKELEESISPSTMRDEIRLTRILIQYCDTKDKKVLVELKEWFAGMNEVQRICMAKSIQDRAKNCYGTDALLIPFRDLYKTIREYDIVAKSDFEIERLKQLGLLD